MVWWESEVLGNLGARISSIEKKRGNKNRKKEGGEKDLLPRPLRPSSISSSSASLSKLPAARLAPSSGVLALRWLYSRARHSRTSRIFSSLRRYSSTLVGREGS